MAEEFRSGFVTLVGRPNAGKSTLINAIMGKKIAITSSTVQTTRHRFRAVLNRPDFQLILVDTPGLHKPQDALGEELNTSALKALEDVDVAAFLVDASKPIGKGDRWIAEQVQRSRAKKICVLSKIDLATEQQISAQREAAEQLGQWDAMVALSAVTGYNVEAFVEEAEQLLPPGPAWFPRDMETDQPLEVMIAEFIREKILRSFSDEIPHAIGVAVDGFEYDSEKGPVPHLRHHLCGARQSEGHHHWQEGAGHQGGGHRGPRGLGAFAGLPGVFGPIGEGAQELAPRCQPNPPLRLRRRSGLGSDGR